MAAPIGSRIKALREKRGLSQEDLAARLGFNDRQTLSAIETGERRVSAEELLSAVRELDAPLDYFTDPYQLAGEGRFSWRQTNVLPERLAAYEDMAGRWVAAYRIISHQVGRQPALLRRALGLTRHSSFEQATAAGERFATEFDLGRVPAVALQDVMERELGILVLHVDAFRGISGAACRLPELDVVLINRNEVVGRRHFDLAHELFHLLTWDAMPPEHAEAAEEISRSRVEQLANCFASAVLMPGEALDRFGPWSGLATADLGPRLNAAAGELAVTAPALKWRLVNAGRLPEREAKSVPTSALRNNGAGRANAPEAPARFSRAFLEVIVQGIERGELSSRRAAGLLDVRVDELAELCAAQGLTLADEL